MRIGTIHISSQDLTCSRPWPTDCVGIAPEVFALGKDNICLAIDPEAGDDEMVLDAARACPVDAITVIDEYEDQIWPA